MAWDGNGEGKVPEGYFFSSGAGEASSLTPFLNSFKVLPRALPSSGSFRGPKIRRAMPRMRSSSGKPMLGKFLSFQAGRPERANRRIQAKV